MIKNLLKMAFHLKIIQVSHHLPISVFEYRKIKESLKKSNIYYTYLLAPLTPDL